MTVAKEPELCYGLSAAPAVQGLQIDIPAGQPTSRPGHKCSADHLLSIMQLITLAEGLAWYTLFAGPFALPTTAASC